MKITKISSRGQIVIPKDFRKDIEKGAPFLVSRKGDTIVLKKLSVEEAWKELDRLFEEGRKTVKRTGLKESDVPKIVERFRKEKRKLESFS